MIKDYYAILGVSEDAEIAEIKAQYQALLLIHHPDKQQQQQVLRMPAQRAFYDSSLKAVRLRANGHVNDDIDLDDMEFREESGHYSAPCRCSGEYVISEDELELGVDTVVCSTCSLIVRIHYESAEDYDQDDD
ncbi:Diphthamide biosynthesis protein 4 [Dissophora globulifera]|nr:Diphthamide biosynthesis protein 4 [Dissophora globulifera]